jgi:hypothetical protein
MLKLMPPFVLKCKVIDGGHMPRKKSQIHRQPRNQWRNEEVAQIAKALDSDEWTEEISPNPARKTSQQRNHGVPQKKKRRNKRHEQEMLHHMSTQQRIGKPIKRRGNRNPDHSKPE